MPPARSLSIFLLALISVKCNSVNHPSVEDSFRQCLITQPASLGYCFGVGAISKLQSLDSNPEFDLIDGVTLSKDQQEYRDAYNFADSDPADFRSWIDSMGHVFSQRSLHWDMGFVYPGLAMRVAPSTTPGGMLEFVLDPHREALNKHAVKEISTGRLLARQFLVPFLLGFKFNVATIIPILFGLLALLAKKAIIISKIALIVSSAFGLGTLLLGNSGNKVQQNYASSGAAFNPGFGNSPYNRYPEEAFVDVHYRGVAENNIDQLKLYGNIQGVAREGKSSKGRNFAWSEDEKTEKPK